MKNLLKEYFEENKFNCSEEQLDQFVKYYEMLLEYNKVMNLTAITEKHDVFSKHFIDSVQVMKFFDFNEKKIIDLGTGAGFPGIPLAILNPNSKFTLVDSLRKRLDFIDTVCETIGLKNVTTNHSRFEDLARKDEFRNKFDYGVSRAVAPLNVLLEYSIPFINVGGKFISYKSIEGKSENNSSIKAQEILKCKFEETYDYELPGNDSIRNLLVFEVIEKTPAKYPRKAGVPKKKPL